MPSITDGSTDLRSELNKEQTMQSTSTTNFFAFQLRELSSEKEEICSRSLAEIKSEVS
jgi:hypothetical protein